MHEASRHSHEAFTAHVLSQRGLTGTQDHEHNRRSQFVYFTQPDEPLQMFLIAVDIGEHKTGVLRMLRIEVTMRDEMQYCELR